MEQKNEKNFKLKYFPMNFMSLYNRYINDNHELYFAVFFVCRLFT